MELWTGQKPNLKHFCVWGCPAHVLKEKVEKFEPEIEVCVFIEYPNGTKSCMIYNSKEKTIIVITNSKVYGNGFFNKPYS